MDDLDPEIGHGYMERPPFRLLTVGDVVFDAFEYDIFAYREERVRMQSQVGSDSITFSTAMFD